MYTPVCIDFPVSRNKMHVPSLRKYHTSGELFGGSFSALPRRPCVPPSYFQAWARMIPLSARSDSKKIHACPCGCACMYTCTRTRTRTHPFPISWKKVHILSLRRDQSAEILCMVSPLLLPITAVPLDHGRLEARSQRLNDSDVLDVF